MKECLTFDDRSSVSTQQEDKMVSVTRLKRTETPYVTSKYRRGFKHLPDIGNFSQVNEMLKNNKNALLKR